MDLPLELRLRIAEYALAKNQPLGFYWLAYQEDKKIGTLKDLDKLNSLSRVSRQLYSEVSNIVLKVNEFEFAEHAFGSEYHDATSEDDHDDERLFRAFNTCKAIDVFLRHVPASCRKHMGMIIFNSAIPFREHAQTECFRLLAKLDGQYPLAHVKAEIYDWSVSTWKRKGKWMIDSWDRRAFMNAGRQYQATLSAPEFATHNRRWRMFPTRHGMYKGPLEDLLDGEDKQMVQRWFTNGI